MNAEQKQRAIKLITYWRNRSITTMPEECFVSGDCMTDLLQELIDAPEPEPVGYTNETELDYVRTYEALPVSGAFWPTSDEDACVALYAAPPTKNQSERHLEMVNAPAPSVPVKPMENIALNEWLDKTEWVQKELNTFPVSSLGMHRADVMRLEIDRLRKLLSAAPTPAEPPADVARDTARLDWLDERNAPHGLGWEIIQMPAGNVHIHTLTGDKAKFESIRDAIDAAREQEGGRVMDRRARKMKGQQA